MTKIIEAKNFEQACFEIEKSKGKVVLKNSEGSHESLGIGYIKALGEMLVEKYGDKIARVEFDADEDASVAIAAMRGGFKNIHFKGNKNIYNKLCDIGKLQGIKISNF